MPDTTCHMSISLDGFAAGPEQSRENPLGRGGRAVHTWHLGDERANDADATAADWLMRPRAAYVMGRNMFGPIRGEWDEEWDGWWGPEPPYHAPVFVLTHHAREPVEMEGVGRIDLEELTQLTGERADLMAEKGIDQYYVDAVRAEAEALEKVVLEKKLPKMPAGQRKNIEGKAASLAKRWAKKSKLRSTT